MASTIRVEAARIPDRNRLLEALRDEGLDAQAEDEVGIVVPVGEGGDDVFTYPAATLLEDDLLTVPTPQNASLSAAFAEASSMPLTFGTTHSFLNAAVTVRTWLIATRQ